MTRVLEFESRAAAAGSVNSLVVLVHGYGADGADLLGLADPLGAHLPHTAFVAPNAPERCSGNPFGYQWFPIPWLDGSSEAAAEAGLMQAADDLNAFLDAQLAHYALPPRGAGAYWVFTRVNDKPAHRPAQSRAAGRCGRVFRAVVDARTLTSRGPRLSAHSFGAW